MIFFALFKVDTFGLPSGLRFSGSMLESRIQTSLQKQHASPEATMIPIYPLLVRFFQNNPTTTEETSTTKTSTSTPTSTSKAASEPCVETVVADYYQTLLQRMENESESITGESIGESAVWLNVLMITLVRFVSDIFQSIEIENKNIIADDKVKVKTKAAELESEPQSESPVASSASASASASCNPCDTDSNSTVLLHIINGFLANLDLPPQLGPVSLLHLRLGHILPIIHEAKVVHFVSTPETSIENEVEVELEADTEASTSGLPEREPLVMEIDFSLAIDSAAEVSTSVCITGDLIGASNIPSLASLPLQAAISSIFFSGRIRFVLDLDTKNPTIAFCFVEDPLVNLEIATAIGHAIQLVNIPRLHDMLISLLQTNIHQKLVSPAMMSFPILTEQIALIHSFFKTLLTSEKKAPKNKGDILGRNDIRKIFTPKEKMMDAVDVAAGEEDTAMDGPITFTPSPVATTSQSQSQSQTRESKQSRAPRKQTTQQRQQQQQQDDYYPQDFVDEKDNILTDGMYGSDHNTSFTGRNKTPQYNNQSQSQSQYGDEGITATSAPKSTIRRR